MNAVDNDLLHLKDDLFKLIRNHGFHSTRFHLTLVLSKNEFDKLTNEYSQFTKTEDKSPLIILSGTDGKLQWTIQVLIEMGSDQ